MCLKQVQVHHNHHLSFNKLHNHNHKNHVFVLLELHMNEHVHYFQQK
jgi:hypothetical protein